MSDRAGKVIGDCSERVTKSKHQNCFAYAGTVIIINPRSCLRFLRTVSITGTKGKAYSSPSAQRIRKTSDR